MLERNRKNLLIALLIVIAALFFLYFSAYQYRYLVLILVINLIFLAFKRDSKELCHSNQPFIDKPLEAVIFTDTHLKVIEQSIELGQIKKVVLELQHGKGSLQLPYNLGGKVCFYFPAKYLYKLKQKFNQHLPDVEYIR